MSLALYWDTETTGLRDPWLQEIAGILVQTDSDIEVWCAHGLVRLPPGVVPEASAFAVHNITAEECNEKGMSIAACCAIFWEQVAICDMIVGYNIEFDLRIMRAMSIRFDVPMIADKRIVELSNWTEPMCQLPPTPKMIAAKRHNFKRPSLSESMRILCPTYQYVAHRALPDAQACRHLHRTIKEKLDDQKGEKQTNEAVTTATKVAGENNRSAEGNIPTSESSGTVERSTFRNRGVPDPS